MKIYSKLLAIVLSFAIVFTTLPVLSAVADPLAGVSDEASTTQTTDTQETDETVSPDGIYPLYELEEKRNITEKHFLMSDGSIQAYVYSENIHFRDGDKYTEIDNNLVEKESNGNKYYTNKKNSLKVKIPETFNDDYIEVYDETDYVKFKLAGTVNKSSGNIKNINKNKKKMTDAPIKNSNATFKSVKADVDISYDLSGNKLKETIILYKKTKKSFAFEVLTSAKSVIKNNDGSVSFYNTEGEEIYTIEAPYMLDSAGEYSNAIEVNLTQSDAGYILSYTADYDWLSDKARVYPVYIDPTVKKNIDGIDITDTYVKSSQTSVSDGTFDLSPQLKVGMASGGVKERAFLKFGLPEEISDSDIIVSAQLIMNFKGAVTASSLQIDLHELTSAFSSSTAWYNQPTYNSVITDTEAIYTGKTYDIFDITKLAKKWHDGSENYGVMLKMHDETLTSTVNEAVYYSMDYFYNWYGNGLTPYEEGRYIIVNYRNNSGIENYWSYSTQDMGDYGTGYVNNYTGNLTFIRPDIVINSNTTPLVLSHVYNSCDVGYFNLNSYNEYKVRGLYGKGWNLNLVQTLVDYSSLSDTNYKYRYTDGDGTGHYFVQSGTDIKDEDGLGYTLTVINEYEDSNTTHLTHKITTKDDTVMKFDDSGYLRRIIDANGNTIKLNYTQGDSLSDDYLTSVTTSSGHTITLYYDTNSTSRWLYYISGMGDTIYYDYIEYNLGRIDGPYNTEFGYSRGKIIYASPEVGSRINYTYYLKNPLYPTTSHYGKIKTVYTDNSADRGNVDTYTYSFGKTVITDSKGNSITYQFDTFGRPTGVYDSLGNIYSTSYTPKDNSSSNIFKNNKPLISSNTTSYSHNLLKDGSFLDFGTGWSYFGANYGYYFSNDTGLLDDNVAYVYAFDNYATEGIYQVPTIGSERQYTFSAYIKTYDVDSDNGGAGLKIETSQNRSFYSELLNGTTNAAIDLGYEHVSVTFTLNAGETITAAKVGLFNATGNITIDAVQLETGDSAGPINLIENSSFEGTNSSYPNSFESYQYTNGFVSGTDSAKHGSNALKINASSTVDSYYFYEQDFYAGAGETYILGMALKSLLTPELNQGYLGSYHFSVEIQFKDGNTIVCSESLEINKYLDDWQWILKPVVLTDYVDNFVIYINVGGAENYLLVDSVFLYKDTAQCYTYDSEGNVLSVSDYADQQSNYEYTSNNLTGVTDAVGAEYDYTYDTNNNVTSAVSSNGIRYDFTYDSYGNPLTTAVTSTVDGNTKKIASSSTYQNNGNYLHTSTDSRGNTTTYTYDTVTGNLTSVTDAKGNTVNYTYDYYGMLEKVSAGVYDVQYYYNATQLYEIITPNYVVYDFTYDYFGRITQISMSDVVLSTTTYKDNYSSLVSRVDYANGTYKTYTYDNYDRLISESVNGVQVATYNYDSLGKMVSVTDYVTNVTTKPYYDFLGRLIRVKQSDGQQTGYTYDNYNRVKTSTYEIDGVSSITNEYIYGSDAKTLNIITGVKQNSSQIISYAYDDFLRTSSKTINTTTPYVVEYGYLQGATAENTTTVVNSIKNGNDTYTYTYDAVGNITSVAKNGTVIESYTYDSLNQLATVTRGSDVYVYGTDGGGNITTVRLNGETVKSYVYDTGCYLSDVLIQYNGQTITYDAIYNPLNYRDGYVFTWSNGRNLATVTKNNQAVASYTYDSDNLRTSKTVNGVTTDYYWIQGVLQAQKTGSEYIIFLYDDTGSAYGFLLKNGTTEEYYYYIFNIQGDVIGIIDSSGTLVVEYTYSAWGELLSVTGTLADTIGVKNPLRYRGYYYDSETGFYYLKSRYYDPVTMRFINADSVVAGVNNSVHGYNLFAYAFNNPVNMDDSEGNWSKWVKKAVKFVAKEVVKPIVKTVQKALSKMDRTLSTGQDFSLNGENISATAQIMISSDTKGNISLQYSLGLSASTGQTPSVSSRTLLTSTNAPETKNLNGLGYNIGTSATAPIPYTKIAGTAGIDGQIIPDKKNDTQYYGVSLGAGAAFPASNSADFGGGVSKTHTIGTINVFDSFDKLYNKIMEW